MSASSPSKLRTPGPPSTSTGKPKPPPTMSLQLPDLLSACNPFELRTNKHCRAISQASEKWLLDSGVPLINGCMTWKGVKNGLLAAACHPSVDAAQLRFVADVWGVVLSHRSRRLVLEDEQEEEEEGAGMFALLSDRLSRIAYKNPGWYIRFLKSQRHYLDARTHLSQNRILPDLESYIELRRDASGLRMALEMVVCAGDLDLRETVMGDGEVGRLRDLACDIAAWAEDIISFAKGIPGKDEPNIVTILMKERGVSLECALSQAGMLIKQSADAFVATEEALLSEPEFANDPEVRRYIRGLRDWIAGFVNWLYETQLFLGEKGNEVRAFGWVFVPVPQ